ncbi:MAG TPA: outer membrane protein transport protein [Polyangia bacterium]|nr:outer membrane protein transport protein [Polyangia bacterium]
MSFVDGEARARARAGTWLAAAIAFAFVLPVLARAAEAAPLDEPFVGGIGFTGPTSPSVSAIYWNPAALGLVRGTQVMVASTVRVSSTTYTPAGATSGVSARDVMQPLQWPVGPGTFMGISSDLGGDRFTIGFATFMPFVEQTKYALSPTNDEPTRYQALQVDLRHLTLTPALSIRFGDVRLGLAPGGMFSTGHLTFAEDTALDVKGATGDARYDFYSGHGLGDAKFSVTLAGGAYYRHGNLEVGVSYQSRPIGSDTPGVEIAGGRTTVTGPPGVAGPTTGCSTAMPGCVFGDMTYRLPDIWIAGVTYHLRPGFEATVMARWIWFHLQDRIDLRFTGPTLEASGVPEHIVIYRGFHDVWDVRGRLSYWYRERVRLGAQLRMETSAVDANAVNAAAVDGFKVEPMALVAVRLWGHVWLDAGYGLTLMSTVAVDDSVFNPALATACVEANNDLDHCAARNAGQGRPSAAGTYTRLTQDFGLSMTVKF